MSITAKLKQWAKQLTADIPAVFLAMKGKRTPLLAKILAAIAVAYALSPIDLIPDFIPVIGYLDDVLLLPILIVSAVKLIPAPVWADCKQRAENLWDGSTGTMTAKNVYGRAGQNHLLFHSPPGGSIGLHRHRSKGLSQNANCKKIAPVNS